MALALKIGEEQYCRPNQCGEGDDGDYERTPVDAGGNQNVDEDQHYDGIRDKFDELAGAVVLDHIDSNAHIPDGVESKKRDDGPCRASYRYIDDRAGDSANDEGETKDSYELCSCRLLLAELGIGDINIHSLGSLLLWD